MTDAGADLREWAEDYIISRGGSVHPDVGAFRYALTGEPYVTLLHSGLKLSGEPWGFVCPTIEAAVSSWQAMFCEYMQNGSGTLYWRTLPQVDRFEVPGGFGIYSRLLISDKPVVRGGEAVTRAGDFDIFAAAFVNRDRCETATTDAERLAAWVAYELDELEDIDDSTWAEYIAWATVALKNKRTREQA